MRVRQSGLTCGAIGLLIAGSGALAANASAPAGDACRQALDRVYQQEESQRATRGAGNPGIGTELAAARRQAVKACLGGEGALPQAATRVQPPLSVAPVGAPESIPATPTLPIPSAAMAPERRAVGPPSLTTVTRCDSAGCWTSDGNYLMRVGPNLAGPPGLCTAQAGILTCR